MAQLIDPRHIAFVLDEVLDLDGLLGLPAFQGHDRDGAAAILETAERLARDHFQPSYGLIDAQEPRMENGRAILPSEIADALAIFRDAGFYGMTADTEAGGLGLPRLVGNAAFLWFQAANVSIANYALLTMSAAELLAHHATPEQKTRYLAPMLDGRFFGTMALSEPQAGSSLGDIRTVARARGDGTYALSGTKMWISGGEHDMAENIVHLMLARIEGAPAGVKGISLFIVPRKRLGATGEPGVWNNVALAGLNHKMGQRGTVNTVLNVGEGGPTIGEIVGAPGQGLACMFTMMNEARVGVSMGAVAHASAAYHHSLAYARERVQGRHPDQKDPSSPQVPLIAHADVRRMLVQQKAVAEGGIALTLYLARLGDMKKAALTSAERADAALLLDFLTPIYKAWISEAALEANVNAIQVLGGAGYTRDHPVEQHYRDNRLNPIHEGTNGIQAIDLLGRKAQMNEGRALALYLAEVRRTAAAAEGAPLGAFGTTLAGLATSIETALAALQHRRGVSGVRAQLAHGRDFLELAGCTTFAWIWLEQARIAAASPTLAADPARRDGLLATCAHVFAHMVPRAEAAAGRIARDDVPEFAMTDAMFG